MRRIDGSPLGRATVGLEDLLSELAARLRASECVRRAEPLLLSVFCWQVFVSKHYACPFGLIASVHGWERIGAAIQHIATFFLHLAILRYVDDYYGPERQISVVCNYR